MILGDIFLKLYWQNNERRINRVKGEKMNWKFRAYICNIINILPYKVSLELYYYIQKKFGRLKTPAFDLIAQIYSGIKIIKKIRKYGYECKDKIFFEVGTGIVPVLGMVYWLCGAKETITIDLNPLLRDALIKERLCYFMHNKGEILNQLGSLVDIDRFNILLDYCNKNSYNRSEYLELCHIKYIAPGDASKTCLLDKSVDYHTSRTVYEHISKEILRSILLEGNRIIKDDGLFINLIDYSDHYAHTDRSISAVNFYQYNDKEWKQYTGNRFYYMNRLRHDDYMELFDEIGHEILETEVYNDIKIEEMIENNEIKVDDKFEQKSKTVLAILNCWFVTRINQHGAVNKVK
jgi:hypothetical protein